MKIGILGLAGAGKDTIATKISKELGLSIDRYAAPLKQAALRVFGESFDDRAAKDIAVPWSGTIRQSNGSFAASEMCRDLGFYEDEMLKAGELYYEHIDYLRSMSPRRYQQLLGTQLVRTVKPNAFVKRIASKDLIVVPDVRFDNELLDINLFVYRPDIEYKDHESEKLAQELQDLVQSTGAQLYVEHPLYGVFHLINNVGSIDDLDHELQYFYNSI